MADNFCALGIMVGPIADMPFGDEAMALEIGEIGVEAQRMVGRRDGFGIPLQRMQRVGAADCRLCIRRDKR
jgi:hypothetical protein